MDQYIDANLRRVYAQTLDEPLPDRLEQLLEQLHQLDARPAHEREGRGARLEHGPERGGAGNSRDTR